MFGVTLGVECGNYGAVLVCNLNHCSRNFGMAASKVALCC